MSPFSSSSRFPVGLKFRPTDTTDLFTEAANHLVTGSALLAEMLSADVDHEYVAKQMREAEHAADETARDHPPRELDLRDAVRPRRHLRSRPGSTTSWT